MPRAAKAAEFGHPQRRPITADMQANALVISSPPENLELLEALVQQFDNLPAAEAQIKVFTIVNGDATNLSDMLRSSSRASRRRRPARRRQRFCRIDADDRPAAARTRWCRCGSASIRGPTASSPPARWAI